MEPGQIPTGIYGCMYPLAAIKYCQTSVQEIEVVLLLTLVF